MNRLAISAALAGIALASSTSHAQSAPTYEVYAIRYATVANFPVRGLIAGADTTRRMDIAMSVWLLRGNGRNVLVDAGFYRDKFVQRWKPTDFIEPAEAVRRAGVRPEQITDIIVSHIHWDHADGIDLFPNARVWIQKEEYQHHVGADGSQLTARSTRTTRDASRPDGARPRELRERRL
jgi:glyoxylase-like metal-dependent hydrolase (beta-lactamase superfamily II)